MLDPNEAPEGFRAVAIGVNVCAYCTGCYFLEQGRKCPNAVAVSDCYASNRNDRTEVIFVRKK